MIPGINRSVRAGERELHFQIEDLGLREAAFDVRVYEKGSVLLAKRHDYFDELRGIEDLAEVHRRLEALRDRLARTLEAAILRGKI